MRGYIYQITNLTNNKLYIGSSIRLKSRWCEHKRDLLRGKHHNRFLQSGFNRLMRKFRGIKDLKFTVLEVLQQQGQEDNKTFLLKLINTEKFYISKLNTTDRKIGYNTNSYPHGAFGWKQSRSARIIMSKRAKERCAKLGPEGISKLRGQPWFEVMHLASRKIVWSGYNKKLCSEKLSLLKSCVGVCIRGTGTQIQTAGYAFRKRNDSWNDILAKVARAKKNRSSNAIKKLN